MIIEELEVPAVATADWIAMVGVRNAVKAEAVGTSDLSIEPDELLPRWQNPHERKRAVLARVDGEVVGRGAYETQVSNPAAWVSVEVLPAFRRRGIGSALHEHLVDFARVDDKSALQTYVTEAAADTTDVIGSPTGFGSVPRDVASSRFLITHGYALEQVGLTSRLELPIDVSALLREAIDAAGPDYATRWYLGRTPEDLLDSIARLRSSMGSDAPSGGMETESEWTAERVRADDDAAASSPRKWLTTTVHHVPSGEVVGYTELDVPPEQHRPVAQGDTIVLAGHRGHRLGMLLKVANIARLEDVAPGHPSITTSNAAENVHMLAVNDTVGFAPWASIGAWKRDV
ncbi:GNAT family N-acetyltransferase [Microbacterium sp. ZW T2_14]|uniref:GNAT family N-acetyltransferase n=1 Tax=Microbacterium sp. ZW T2_14 TaxID=3378079 RepID=UPI003852D024